MYFCSVLGSFHTPERVHNYFDLPKASEFDQKMSQSQTTDQSTHHNEEAKTIKPKDTKKTMKVKQPELSSSAR